MYGLIDKAIVERISVEIDSANVPVFVANPDTDFKDAELPAITIMMYDTLYAPVRRDETIIFQLDDESTPTKGIITDPLEPFDLYYQITTHAKYEQDDRTLVEAVFEAFPPYTYLTVGSGVTEKTYDMYMTQFARLDIMGEKRLFKKALSFVVEGELDRQISRDVKIVETRELTVENSEEQEF